MYVTVFYLYLCDVLFGIAQGLRLFNESPPPAKN